MIRVDCESGKPPPVGGYCLSGCRLAFASESAADAHTAMTGHATGWPIEAVDHTHDCNYGDLDCTHCGGEGICYDGADPLGNCPDEFHRCHACGGPAWPCSSRMRCASANSARDSTDAALRTCVAVGTGRRRDQTIW